MDSDLADLFGTAETVSLEFKQSSKNKEKIAQAGVWDGQRSSQAWWRGGARWRG